MKIKSRFLLVVLSSLMVNANAQFMKSLALKGGLAMTNLSRTTSQFKPSYKLGVYSALEIEWFRSKHVAVFTNFAYTQKGYQTTIPETTDAMPDGTGRSIAYKASYYYASFSPIVHFKTDLKHWNPYVLVGPRLDILTKDVENGRKIQHLQGFNNNIWGLTTGMGLARRIGNCEITAEALYMQDFSRAFNNRNPAIRNVAYIFALGLKYDLPE